MCKHKFIDLFAGCGGLSLGLEQASFQPVLISELNPAASATYIANRNQHIVNIPDIKKIKQRDVKQFKNIDLICGGPPCQGYSGIGIRRTHNVDKDKMARNQLYREMIRVIELVKPKIFLFENVRGLLTGKWNASGEKGEIFHDVLSSFVNSFRSNYIVRWELVKSSSYGVPQNRPRVFIVGLHRSLRMPAELRNIDASFEDILHIHNGSAINDGLFPPPTESIISGPEDVIGDLIDDNYNLNGFETESYQHDPYHPFQKEMRQSKTSSKEYFVRGDGLSEQRYSRHRPDTIKKFELMLANNGEIPEEFITKKFSQRILIRKWKNNLPTITVTSLPDDYVHFSQPRILTVREWARFQTFPDWYQFKGKRTTGGSRRAGTPDSTADQIEVPKYSQIGNAVPVKLAYEFGKHFRSLLK